MARLAFLKNLVEIVSSGNLFEQAKKRAADVATHRINKIGIHCNLERERR